MVDSYLEAYLILSEYLAENGIYYSCRTRISVMTLKVLITLYGMIARQYMAGKGNGGSYISDCREVRNTVKNNCVCFLLRILKERRKTAFKNKLTYFPEKHFRFSGNFLYFTGLKTVYFA